MNMKNTELAFCKFSKYPILKSIRVKFSRYKQKSMNVSVSFDTLILIYKKRSAKDAHCGVQCRCRKRPPQAQECAEAHSLF